jgi:hypothetical protein
MTEAEWWQCSDPDAMLKLLRDNASDRKLRLFATACCRRVWLALSEEAERRAVEVAERYADGQAATKERAEAYESVGILGGGPAWQIVSDVTAGALDIPSGLECSPGELAASTAAYFLADAYGEAGLDGRDAKGWACETLRCIFGNAPCPAIFDCSRATPVVHALAEAVYEHRLLPGGELDPARLGVLADALEDAGCSDELILLHLRSSGPHVRGCWALDLILGKS